MVVLVVALIVLGPEKLPQVARQAGRALNELRQWSSSLQDEVKGALEVEEEPQPMPPASGVIDGTVETPKPTDLEGSQQHDPTLN